LKTDVHLIAMLKFDIFAKAKGIGPKKMDVQLPGYAVLIVFKVMVLQIFRE
jgi:hypothetical protein